MKGITGHTSYYVNVAQTIGIVGGVVLGFKALRIEEAKAGIEHRPIKEVVQDDILRVKNWYYDNFTYKQYPHR